jgi:hypothetical protein
VRLCELVFMLVALCACGSGSGNDSQATATPDSSDQTATDTVPTSPPLLIDHRFQPGDEGAAYDGAGADEAAFADKVNHSFRVSQYAQPGTHINANVEVRCEIEKRFSKSQVIARCSDSPSDAHDFVVEAVPKLSPHDRFHIYGHVEPGFHFNAAGTVFPAIVTDYFLP